MVEVVVTIWEPSAELPVVIVKGFQVAVDVMRRSYEAQIECAECSEVLEVILLNEAQNNVLLWLQLEQLEYETDEGSRLFIPSKAPSNGFKFNCTVHDGLAVQAEAFTLPIKRTVNPRTDDLLNKILRIRTMHPRGTFVSTVGHSCG